MRSEMRTMLFEKELARRKCSTRTLFSLIE